MASTTCTDLMYASVNICSMNACSFPSFQPFSCHLYLVWSVHSSEVGEIFMGASTPVELMVRASLVTYGAPENLTKASANSPQRGVQHVLLFYP